MNKLPMISGRECIVALEKVGFYIKRHESSHVILRRDDTLTPLFRISQLR